MHADRTTAQHMPIIHSTQSANLYVGNERRDPVIYSITENHN